MANRVKQNRAEQDEAPNMHLVKPGTGDIHSAVGAPKAGSVTTETEAANARKGLEGQSGH